MREVTKDGTYGVMRVQPQPVEEEPARCQMPGCPCGGEWLEPLRRKGKLCKLAAQAVTSKAKPNPLAYASVHIGSQAELERIRRSGERGRRASARKRKGSKRSETA